MLHILLPAVAVGNLYIQGNLHNTYLGLEEVEHIHMPRNLVYTHSIHHSTEADPTDQNHGESEIPNVMQNQLYE